MKRANPVWSSSATSQDASEKLNLFNSLTKQKVIRFWKLIQYKFICDTIKNRKKISKTNNVIYIP